MQTTQKTSAQIFKEAIDWFFGHNPANPFWFLFVLCLRKKNLLSIEENYSAKSINNLTHNNSRDYWTGTTPVELPAGVNWYSVVGLIEDNQRLIDIYREFETEAQMRLSNQRSGHRNIFSKYQWEDLFLIETVQLLLSIDDEWLNQNFIDCFNIALRRIYANERYDLYSQPIELTQLVGHICYKIGEGVKRVYNPFAGLGSYALFAGDAVYIGEELMRIVAAIANLRIFAIGVNGEVSVRDSINDCDYNADLIVSTPPFMVNVRDPYLEEHFDGRNDTSTLLMRKCAMKGIKGIIITPIGTSARNDYCKRVRAFLIEQDCLDMVIELPANIFEGAAVATAIYVINPNHNHKGAVRIINATECFTVNKAKNILNVCEILSIIDSDNQNSILVENDTLARKDYSLLFSRYFQPIFELPEGSNLMRIGELGEIFVNRAPRHITKGKFASFLKLSNPNKLKIYTASDFEEEQLPASSGCFNQDCIIVSGARGLRANCMQPKGEMIYVPASYFCFIPNQNVILPQYLVLQLQSDLIEKQVGGRYIATVRRNEFLDLRVIVPSIEEQRKAIEDYQASLISKLGVQVNDLKTQRFNEFERNMHLRKHALNQILNDIVPATRSIYRFISNQDGAFTKNDIVAKRTNSSLESYMHKLLRNVIKVQDLIDVLTDEESYDEPETIDMKAFFAEYEQNKLSDRYKLSIYDFPGISSESDDFNDDVANLDENRLTAYISKSGLVTIFDNIIANAVNHGFTDQERIYMIRINYANILTEDGKMLEIRIMNNGEKLPDGMTPDKIFTWGIGSGTGYGSWQTKNIVEHYGGYIEFNQFDDNADGFNIEYRIILPMTE